MAGVLNGLKGMSTPGYEYCCTWFTVIDKPTRRGGGGGGGGGGAFIQIKLSIAK